MIQIIQLFIIFLKKFEMLLNGVNLSPKKYIERFELLQNLLNTEYWIHL